MEQEEEDATTSVTTTSVTTTSVTTTSVIKTAFYSWLLEGAHHFSVDVHGASWVPEIVWQFVEQSPSVKATFPDPFGKDQVIFNRP